jgi:hypothetical protein
MRDLAMRVLRDRGILPTGSDATIWPGLVEIFMHHRISYLLCL